MSPESDNSKYTAEMIYIAFEYARHPERKKYFFVLKYALELAYICGDWEWYEKVKARKVPSKAAYKRALETDLRTLYLKGEKTKIHPKIARFISDNNITLEELKLLKEMDIKELLGE